MVAAVVALGGAHSSTAWHLHLKRAEPGVNDTVAVAPRAIRLWFTETPEVAGARVTLTAVGGAAVTLGKPWLESGDDPALTANVTGPLAAGTYQVGWRAMARDGHTMAGTFRFVLRPARGQ
jgi:methionine-rich copper-binding protein CopC